MRLVISFFLLCATGVYGWQNVATFNSDTNLVQVSVVAHDSKDRTVAGLTKDDFEIFDNGERREIASFSLIAESQPTGSFANRAGQAGPVVILLDWINTGPRNEAWSRQRAIEALRSLPAGQQAALFVAQPGRLRMLHGFTTDHDSIARTIEEPKEVNDQARNAGSDSTFDLSCLTFKQLLKIPQAEEFQRRMRDRIRGAIGAFQFLSQELAPIQGRKTVIWVSGGFTFPACESMSTDVDRAVRALNNANVGVYAVDARGVTLGDTMPNVVAMRVFSDRTGGQIYFNRNDTGAQIAKAVEDSRLSYTIGFYRSGDSAVTAPHKIRIRSLKRGITLSYRDSYTPEQPAAALGILAEALAVPLTVDAAKGDGAIDVTLHIDGANLTLAENGSKWRGGGQIISWFSLPNGNPLSDAVFKTIDANMTEENRDKFLRNGISYRMTLAIPEKAAALHISLTDNGSGHTGKLSVPLAQIPAH